MITADRINISVGKEMLFENLSFELNEGVITGIIAPSGTGKTTIFNSIIGLHKYEGGRIVIDGQRLDTKQWYDNLSFMPQEGGIYSELTATQNIKFFMSLRKKRLSKSEINTLLKEYDLYDARKKKVESYSGGMKKKLSLLISLLGDSKYYFLDEPTVGIDPVQKEEFWNRLYQLRDSGKTIIITTHVMDEASRCDQIMFLRNGKIIATGNKEQIFELSNSSDLNQAFINLAGGSHD